MTDPKIKYDIEANVTGDADVGQLATRIEQLAGTLDGDLKTSALASAEALRQLAQKDGAVQNFVDLKREAQQAAQGLKDAQAAAQTLGSELATVQNPTRAQAGQLQKLRDAVRDAKTEVIANNAAVIQARAGMAQYGISTDNLSQSQRNIKTAIAQVKTEVNAMAPAWQGAATGATASAGKQVKASDDIKTGLRGVGDQLRTIQNIAVAALGGSYLGGLAKELATTADEFTNLSARIKIVTGDGADFTTAFEGVQKIALRTNSDLTSTGELFTKIAQAGKELGLSQQAALALTESINQSIQLSGGSAESAKAAIIQLIQGLQSGVLRGEEFNSIMEQSPRLARALADGLGVTTGALRKMSQEGALSSGVVINALQKQSAVLQAEFGKLPATVGRSITNLETQWMLFIGGLNNSTGATSYVAAGIDKLAGSLDTVARVAGVAGAALTVSLAVQGVAALRAYMAEAALAAGATNLLSTSINKVPKTVNIAVAVTGFEAGYQLGTWLRETFESARKFGVAVTGYAQVTVSSLQFIKEAAAAVFSSDTIDAAMARFEKRNEVMRSVIKDMWVDAEQAPQKIGDATDQATAKSAQLGAAAQAAGGQVAAAGAAGAAGVGQVGKAAVDALSIFRALLAEASKPAIKDGAIDGIVKSLIEAKAKGLDFNALLQKELPDAIGKLSGPDLAKFRQDFAKAMQEGGARGAELQTGLRLIGDQAAKSLGVDVVIASNQISKSFRDSDEAMRMLILSMPALKAAGIDTGKVVSEALSKMLDSTQSQAEIDAVIRRIEAMRKALGDKVADGLLDQAKQKAELLKDALDKATPGVTSLREAMKMLGVTSDETLKNTATQSKAAYDAMTASGTSSARELGDGFKKMAADSIAASGEVGSTQRAVTEEILKSEGAVRGLSVSFDASGKLVVQTQAEVAAAIARTTGVLGGQKDAVDAVTSALERQNAAQERANAAIEKAAELERKRLNVDKEGFSTDKSGNRIAISTPTQRSVYENAKGQGLTEAQAIQISNQFIQNGKQVGYGGANAGAGENWSTMLQKAIDELVLANASKNAATGTPGSPTTTVNVRISPPDGNTYIVPTTQDGSRQLIAALQSAKLSSGY